MKKSLLFLTLALMLGVTLLSGCSAGVAPEDFVKVKSDLTAAQA
jgi:outer membrane murein-binding lipoprotein Lpp